MTGIMQIEKEAQALMRAAAQPPFLFQLGPAKGRLALDKIQAGPGPLPGPAVEVEDREVQVGPAGKLPVRLLRPQGSSGLLPVILYVHGGGWVFGNAHTHDRLIRELAAGAQAALVFPSYSLSPEARFPGALEEVYALARWLSLEGRALGLDPSRIVIAGDSVGGNMATALTLMAKQRGAQLFVGQLLLYPVTNAAFNTPSYLEFAEGYGLRRDAMEWFWDQYIPGIWDREKITASPLRASLEELAGLPEALVITAEADVLRDEGEAYAHKLRRAGVRVTAARFQGIIHDFLMLDALATTAAARGALGLSVQWLRGIWDQAAKVQAQARVDAKPAEKTLV
jgi:acetyl esterase